MVIRVFLIFLLIVPSALATPAGAWNGKPYKREVLEAGVKKGHIKALAEWAYCSYYSFGDIPYDEKLIFARANEAAKKNDPLGIFMVGACAESGFGGEEDMDAKCLKFIQASAKAEHPLGYWKLGVFYRLGIFGLEKDAKKGVAMIQKAKELGCLNADHSLSIIYRLGELGEIDLEKTASLLKKLLKVGDTNAAVEVARARVRETKHRSLHDYFSEEEYARSEEILRHSAFLGDPFSTYYLGYMLMRIGKPHEGIPLLIKNSRMRDGDLNSLVFFSGRKIGAGEVYIRCLASDYKTEWKAAAQAHKKGTARENLKRLYADSVLMGDIRKKNPEEEEAVTVLLDLIQSSSRGDCQSSHSLGRFFTHKFLFQKGTEKKEFERGMAHYQLHGNCPPAAHWTGLLYGDDDERIRDIPKAIAALHRAVEINTGAWKLEEERKQKKLLKIATDEEKKAAEDLIADKWPYGKKHREKAFLFLQKIGDIPADQEFDENLHFPNEVGGF